MVLNFIKWIKHSFKWMIVSISVIITVWLFPPKVAYYYFKAEKTEFWDIFSKSILRHFNIKM